MWTDFWNDLRAVRTSIGMLRRAPDPRLRNGSDFFPHATDQAAPARDGGIELDLDRENGIEVEE